MKPRVLLAEDEKAVAETLVYALTTDGCDVLGSRSRARARAVLTLPRVRGGPSPAAASCAPADGRA